jgi:hypothetical protein
MLAEQIRGLYFSGHHLTRDLIGNVAPLTAFSLAAIAAVPSVQSAAIDLFKNYLMAASFWTFILAVTVYLVGGYFVGAVVAFTANFMQRALSHAPRFGSRLSYTYWYNKDAQGIDALYRKLFPDYQYFTSGAVVTPTDKINTLKECFRKYNPDGYRETYRQFMKVDVVRAAMFYSAAVLLWFSYSRLANGQLTVMSWPLVLLCLFTLMMALAELPRRIRKVVRTEYFFIIATARIRDDLEQDKAATAASPST